MTRKSGRQIVSKGLGDNPSSPLAAANKAQAAADWILDAMGYCPSKILLPQYQFWYLMGLGDPISTGES